MAFRGDTAMIISVCAGILIGSWTNFRLGHMAPYPYPPPYTIIWPDRNMLRKQSLKLKINFTNPLAVLAALRTILGFGIVLALRMFCKIGVKIFLCWVLDVDGESINNPKLNTSRRATFVELCVKFVTYFIIGFSIVYAIPVLFRYLGIERPTFYTEI